MEGPPSLVVEILSPSDNQEDIIDKVESSLAAGEPIVWIVEPRLSTVTVYRSDARPQLFDSDRENTAEPIMPGFRVMVASLFEDLDQ